MEIKLTDFAYNEWVDFVFGHPAPDPVEAGLIAHPHATLKGRAGRHRWFERHEPLITVGDERLFLKHLTRLFEDPEFLLNRFAREQVEQGFWLLMHVTFRAEPGELFWNESIPWELRRRAIESMGRLYARLFARDPLWTASFMWWDNLTYVYSNNGHTLDATEVQVRDVMLDVLRTILELPTLECQEAALHGLNHLRHPEGSSIIDRWLAERPGLDPELKEFALACKLMNYA